MTGEHQFNRRASDTSNIGSSVRKEILEQLSEIDDQAYRVLLSLLLKTMDETNIYFSTLQSHMIQIHTELAKLQRTDDQIRNVVLNGHSDKHHTHHSWIDNQMQLDAQCGMVLGVHGDDGLCDHARQLVEDAKVAKVRRWKIVDGLAEKAVWLILMFFAGLAGAKLFPGVFQ